MSKLDDIIDGGGETIQFEIQAKQQIKDLMLELIGENEPPSMSMHDYSHEAVNEYQTELRQKVNEL